MKFFLKLKHWQLFGITWGPSIMFTPFIHSGQDILFAIQMLFLVCGIFGWMGSIVNVFHNKLPSDARFKLVPINILFLFPIIDLLLETIGIFYDKEQWLKISSIREYGFVLPLLSLVCIFIGLRFAAKTLKSIELGRAAKFHDYKEEFFLIWFSVIGIWVLQPKLNKLVQE